MSPRVELQERRRMQVPSVTQLVCNAEMVASESTIELQEELLE
jgi:hypothetical protein